MRRSLACLVLTALVAVGLSGCDTNLAPGAAKVGSTTISSGTIDDALSAIANNKGYLCTLVQSNASVPISVEGAGSGTFDLGFAASQLSLYIKHSVLSSLLGAAGITPSAASLDIATTRLGDELNPPAQSTCTISGAAIIASMPTKYREFLVATEVEQDLLAAHIAGMQLTSAGLGAFAAEHRAAAYDDCVSAIIVGSAALAASDRAQIEAGASFASVARATSTDQSSAPNGGALGCIPGTEFKPPLSNDLAALAVGQLSEAISFSGSFVLLEITARQAPTEVEELNYLLSVAGAKETTEVNAAEALAKVSVDPKYGSWQKVGGEYQVVPPVGPALKDLVNSDAVSPPILPLS